MIRAVLILAMAAPTVAFQPLAQPASVGNTALHLSSRSVPFYASTTTLERPTSATATLEPPTASATATLEHPQEVKSQVPVAPKKAPMKKKGPAHQEGVFSPMVLFVKGALGDQTLNKVRGKAISLHSDVIGSFVATSDSAWGDAVLRSLFKLADTDGNGHICKEELRSAVQLLGFTWLKEKQIEGIFKRADADGNGEIDLEEWISEAPKTLRTNLTKLAKKNGGEMGFLV